MERLYNLLKFRHPGCEGARTESRYLLSKREDSRAGGLGGEGGEPGGRGRPGRTALKEGKR